MKVLKKESLLLIELMQTFVFFPEYTEIRMASTNCPLVNRNGAEVINHHLLL